MENPQETRLPADVVSLSLRVAAWRRTRARGSPMPEGLWTDAVRLARIYGVSAVARPIGLHYGKLKERIRVSLPVVSASPTFLEISSPLPLPVSRECLVEMKRPDGGLIVIRMANDTNLVSLCESFWREHE